MNKKNEDWLSEIKGSKKAKEEFEDWLSEMWARKSTVRSPNIATYKILDDIKEVLESGRFLPIENAFWSLMELDKLISDSATQSFRNRMKEAVNKIFERLIYFLEIQNIKK